jgi:hypothetical protein
MIPRTPFYLRAGLVLAALMLSSCGFGRMATGVMVWAPDGSQAQNGDIVWIWEQSRIRKTFKIERPQGGGSFEVDQWRVKAFSDEGQAKAFQTAFTPLKDTWAVSGKQGLPVRETADANANRVYKLGDSEEAKVIGGNGPRVKQGNLEGSWVQILTHDGYTGWVFDFYLTVVNRANGANKVLKGSGPGDQLVQSVLAQEWFPDDMRAMVDQDRINLNVFRADAGLRASDKSFLLVLPGTPDERLELPVDKPKKIDSSTYDFGGPDKTQVQFANTEGSKMTLLFTWQGKARSVPLTLLDDNVGTLVSRELANRQQKLSEIEARGKTLVSPTYGTIRLAADSFTWTGGQTALGGVTETTGKVLFDWFADQAAFGKEFRAVRFQFGSETGPSRVFLYRFLKDGFQLLPAGDADLDPVKQTVTHQPASGLSLFFNFQD